MRLRRLALLTGLVLTTLATLASGVLASVTAVGISMGSGIHASLYTAVEADALPALPAAALGRAGSRVRP